MKCWMFSNSGCCSLLELLEGDILVDKEEDNNVVENERALAKTEFGWLRRQGERQVGKGRALLSSSGRVGETSCSEGELSTKSSTSPSSPSRIVEFRLRFTFAGSGRDFGTLAVHWWKEIDQQLVRQGRHGTFPRHPPVGEYFPFGSRTRQRESGRGCGYCEISMM